MILTFSVMLAKADTLNVPGDHATIQAAINAATAGDIVEVAAGEYVESHVTINKSLTLRGPNYGNSPNFGSRVPEAVLTGAVGITIPSSAAVVVEGFQFTGGAPLQYYGVSGTAHHDIVFRKNLIDGGSAQLGIFANSATNEVTAVVDDNRFLGMSGNAMQIGGVGTITATVTNNVIDGTVTAGINADTLSNSTISGNTISNTGHQGIQVALASSNVTVSGNTITNANTSDGADRGAIRIYGSSFTGTVKIIGNMIIGGNTAFAVRNGEDISGKDIQFTGNTMTGINGPFVYHGGTGTLDATGNFWGSAAGPGGLVSGDVNASNFFSDETLSEVFSRPDVAIGSNMANLRSAGRFSAPRAVVRLTSRKKARRVKGLATVANLGGLTEPLAVRANKGNRLFRAKYKTNEGNVTASMAAGTYRTPQLDASSPAMVIHAVFAPKRGKSGRRGSKKGVQFSSLLLARSSSNATLSDGGWWKVRAR